MRMELAFFAGATVLYAAATALALAYLRCREESISLWMFRLLAAGVVVHAASFGFRLHDFWLVDGNRYFIPVKSFFGALSYMSLAVALTFAVVEGRYRLGILGAFVIPWSSIGTGIAVFRAVHTGSTDLANLAPELRSYWMNLHPVILMTAYALLSNAFGVGWALLIQERQLKSRHLTDLTYRLPPIDELESLNTGLIACAFPVLLIGLAMGIVWAHAAWDKKYWQGDAKVVWAVITALVYGTYLLLRFRKGWRGRKAVYVSMAGFACVVFTFVGVNFISKLHGYLQ